MKGRPFDSQPPEADELQRQIRELSPLPDEVRDNILARVDALGAAELRALDRHLAAAERGRRAIGSASELTAAEIRDAIAYLTLAMEAKR